LSSADVLRSAPAIAITGLSTAGASSKAATPSAISSPAGSTHSARGSPNRLIAPASSASSAGSERTAPPATTNRVAPRPLSSRSPRLRDWPSSGP
jgi:hypothetical protein